VNSKAYDEKIITNNEVFQRAKEERLLLKFSKNRRYSWTWHKIRHNEFLANIFEGAIFGKKKPWEELSTTILKANRQKHRN
jgi:hypothetical protein